MAYADGAVAPTPDALTQKEQRDIKLEGDKWSDEYALKIFRSDFSQAEAFRTNGHDWRWRNADELYLAWMGQRYWDGTRVPRSSLGIYVVFEQVESMLPQLVKLLCDPENIEAVCADYDSGLAWRKLILDQLEENQWREQVRKIAKSACVYGNGIGEVGIENHYEEQVTFDRIHRVSRVQPMQHPILGQISVPVDMESSFTRSVKKIKQRRPYLKYIPLKDFFIDPNCTGPDPQLAGYTARRSYIKAGEVKELKGNDFNIPDDETLEDMTKSKTISQADVSKQTVELFRYTQWQPAMDYSVDPYQRRLELIEYTTKLRKVWVLNRDWVLYNQPNKYGVINYFSMSYADVMDRFYALGISDVAEGEQRFQGAVINARVDELALSIHTPVAKRRGVTIPAYQLKRRPGQVIETENPKDDIVQQDISNVTQQANVEVQASELRVQKITGITDLASLGAPTSGGNSASRTATGVNTQTTATGNRIGYTVENCEDQFMEPVLNFFVMLNKRYGDAKQAEAWLKDDAQFAKLDPLKVMNQRVKMHCRGAVKLAAKMGFLQIWPTLFQTIMNPEMLQLMAQQTKKKLNVEQLSQMVFDSISYKPKDPMWISMEQPEIEAMQQPSPSDKLKLLLQHMQTQSKEKISDDRNKTKLLGDFVTKGMDTHAKFAQMDNDLISQQQEAQQQSDSGDSGGAEEA